MNEKQRKNDAGPSPLLTTRREALALYAPASLVRSAQCPVAPDARIGLRS